MSQAWNQTIEVALADPHELAELLRQQAPADAAVSVHSDYRDFSIIEVACTAAVSGVAGLVIDLLRDYIKRHLSRPAPTAAAVSVRIGQVVVEFDPAISTPAEVDAAFDRLRAAANEG